MLGRELSFLGAKGKESYRLDLLPLFGTIYLLERNKEISPLEKQERKTT